MAIHASSIIGKDVEIAKDVEIGPFTLIHGKVKIGRGTKIDGHATIGNPHGIVQIGEDNHILSGAMVGGPPQDSSYKGEPTQLIIGNKNVIREFTTLNCGTVKGGGVTKIGNQCMIMAYVHIAHDCDIGNSVIIANSTQFAGHVVVGDYARLGGMCGVVQFIRIGRYAYLGGGSVVNKDILPYSIAEGNWCKVRAANKVGLQRAGFSKEEVESIYRAIRALIMGNRTIDEAMKKIASECAPSDHIKYLIDFVNSSESGVAR